MRNHGPDPATLLEIYRRAKLIMQNDARIRSTIRAGRIAAPYYSPRGQEVIPAAISVHLSAEDYIVTTYRGMHDQIAKGVPLRAFWAEYSGKATGTCKGKGGPMHITHPESGVMVTTGIVGSGLPIANGFALKSQIAGEDRVTVVSFGDGASNIGAFHEALNMAAVWKLGVVFVCQNNLYGEKSALDVTTSVPNIAVRAAGYGIPGVTVNGNDADEMWSAAGDAIARARAGDGPTLIEARTFRFLGHVLGDDNSYMKDGELAAAMEADPLPRLRASVIERGAATAEEVEALEAGIEAQIDDAVAFAAESPIGSVDELRTDVFAEELAA